MSDLSKKISEKYDELDTVGEKFAYILVVLFFGAVFFVAIGFTEMWLWNWLMPLIFGLSELSFWQTIGLDALIFLFFGHPES
jgi:hypothetical protein